MSNDYKVKIILPPMIRKIMPNIFTQDIADVQPTRELYKKYSIVKVIEIDSQKWYNIRCGCEIWQWIIDAIDDTQYQSGTNLYQYRMIRMTISEETIILLKLKWS